MKRKFSYSIGEMNRRLLAIRKPIRKYIVISTIASILGALSHMGLMGFGALWLLAAAGICGGMGVYAALTVSCAILIAVRRYLEGVFSHLGAYGILAKMRAHLFDAIDRVASLPNFFVYLARILILVCAGVLASQGVNQPVGTIAISFAATALLSSTFNLTFVVTSLLETYGAAERIFRIEDTVPETREPEEPIPCGEIQTIEFRDVTFSYPNTEQKVWEHFNYVIRKGDRIGIAGESGVGKSTILRLLLRFYAPTEGEILINGIPLERISFAELHRRIAFMEQDSYLFDATIAENIGIAKPGATIEEIRGAAERAGIADFIETLSDGYDTDMGQMSARLSGGERQRIGIARDLLRDPDVCLMDEPSSALDALHEKELLHTLQTEYTGKTLILISHRSSTLTGCNRLLKMGEAEG